jgi:hypothetical protein
MSFGYTSDNVERSGFISKDLILEYVPERDIFELVFGFKPEEYQYTTSPLRVDETPGCWFEHKDGKFLFRDFGSGKMPLDCFDVVQQYFGIKSFYKTLEFVHDRLIKGKKLDRLPVAKSEVSAKKKVEIYCVTRNFVNSDAKVWSKYGISKQNLIEDNVFPVSNFTMTNTKVGTIKTRVNKPCYMIALFESRKKLYLPTASKDKRFYTNCTKDDIGSVNTLPPFGRELFFGKSYKDSRVLRNEGKHSMWNQNEGMMPSPDVLLPIVKRFKRVYVFFDNDAPGIQASLDMSQLINSYFPGKAIPVWLPESLNQRGITDPSDLYAMQGRKELQLFLNELR